MVPMYEVSLLSALEKDINIEMNCELLRTELFLLLLQELETF